MILYENGRYRTVWNGPEVASEDEEIQKQIASLSPSERKALEEVLKLSSQMKENVVFGNDELKELPVSMHTFVHDPYYLGNTCDVLYPAWERDLNEIFKKGYSTCVFTGAIGSGKSFAASVGVMRLLYELSLLKDPHKTFNIAPGSNISIVAFSVTETLAQKVAYDNITTKLIASPYFKEKFKYEITKKEIRFPNNIWVAPRATTDTSALGLNVISGFIDEANFMQAKKGKGEEDEAMAEKLYTQLWRRMNSRFKNRGHTPGKIFIVSSKTGYDSFSETLIRNNMDNPEFWVSDYATWGVKPKETYSKQTFRVLVGTDAVPSKILTPKDEEDIVKGRLIIPEDAIIDTVPMDYLGDYQRDLEKCIQDMSGLATVSISPFIHQREKIVDAVTLYKQTYPGMEHPFTALEHVPGKPNNFVWGHITKTRIEKTDRVQHAYPKPIINPNAIRHAHIDPSVKGDSTGVCIAHISDWKDVQRRASDGTIFYERAPVYTVDLLLRVTPPTGGEILLGDIREIIYSFTNHGYLITQVTLDGWGGSIDSIQQFNQKGYESKKVSVDLTMDPYINLKNALYEDRVLFYDYPPLQEELIKLQKISDKQKIDHPPKGRKDVADALCGCLWTLSQGTGWEPVPFIKGDRVIGNLPPTAKTKGAPIQHKSLDMLPLPFLTGSMDYED